MDVGFIGLGNMGLAMARNLAKAGHAVRAWNRSPVTDPSLTLVKTAREAFHSDVVFTMLSDDAALRAVVLDGGLLKDAPKHTIHVGASTISIAFAEDLTARHAEAGISYISSPVFGRPDVAAAAQLNVVVAGDASAIDKVAPLLTAIGRKVWLMGDKPAQANAAKIAGNMMIGMAVEAMAEATQLSEGNGVPAKAFFELVLESLFGCRVYQSYSMKIIAEEYAPGFKLTLALKDMGLAAQAAERTGKRLPMLDSLRSQMTEAVHSGLGDKDLSALADYMRKT